MKEGSKKVSLCVLALLTVVLVGVIVFLTYTIKNKNELQKSLEQQVQELSEQKSKLKADLAIANVEKQTVKEETIKKEQSVNRENLNEETESTIKKLLLEKMPQFSFQESAKDKYKIVAKYINKIEIYSEPYVGTTNSDIDIQRYAELTKNEHGDVLAIGRVTFSTEFDKEVEHDDIVYAGGSHSQMLYKNYVVQDFIFRLYKLDSGEYELELGTGW